jgi:hypothetical protein
MLYFIFSIVIMYFDPVKPSTLVVLFSLYDNWNILCDLNHKFAVTANLWFFC